MDNRDTYRCLLSSCIFKNSMCTKNKIVYECICQCGANYIGSTYRALHLRLKEHINTNSSPIWKHNSACKFSWAYKIFYGNNNIINLRVQETLIIAKKPSLNTIFNFLYFKFKFNYSMVCYHRNLFLI